MPRLTRLCNCDEKCALEEKSAEVWRRARADVRNSHSDDFSNFVFLERPQCPLLARNCLSVF